MLYFLSNSLSFHTTGPKAIAWQDLCDVFGLHVISAMYNGTTQIIAEIIWQ